MSNAVATIPTNLPAHISSLFAQLGHLNTEASAGISTGMYPIIKLSGTRFVLVKDGEEKTVKSLELKVVILRAKQGFEKRYYAEAYDPNSTEAKSPDCYSLNGVYPEAACTNPQNTACAGCAMNQFGTGKDASGNPGKGKACSDRKLLAVLYPNPDTQALEVYGLSLPPASLKAFGAYVNTLTANNVPMPAAFTLIGFDEKSSYPVLTFSFGGVLGDKEAGTVIPMIESAEVKAIIDAKSPAVSPVAPVPAPVPAPGLTAKQAEAQAQAPVKVDTGGFGFTTEPEKTKTEKPKKEKTPLKVVDPIVEEETTDSDMSDDDLSSLLGINL
jgi:hypothetical protein